MGLYEIINRKENMSDFNWCHGTRCHKNHTQDRIRGTKGSKVLRTRKITLTSSMKENPNWSMNYFCSNGCERDFWNEYGNQIRAIAPRLEPLETPIEVETIKHPEHTTEYGWTQKAWTEKRIVRVNQD